MCIYIYAYAYVCLNWIADFMDNRNFVAFSSSASPIFTVSELRFLGIECPSPKKVNNHFHYSRRLYKTPQKLTFSVIVGIYKPQKANLFNYSRIV